MSNQHTDIKMLCEEHKSPAVFFSNEAQKYFCFKCLVTSSKLLFIDTNYKTEIEDFERIKKLTEDSVSSTEKLTNNLHEWR